MVKHEARGQPESYSESYEHQPDAVLNQANPANGTSYEVLATTEKVRIIGMAVRVTFSVAVTSVRMIVVVDGETLTYSLNLPATNTPYYPIRNPNETPANQDLTVTIPIRAFLLEGKSVQISAQRNGGTCSNLTCRVQYAVKGP